MFNFWWSAEWSEQQTSTKMQKNEKRPSMSSRNQMLIFGLHSTSDDWLNDLSDKCRPKCKKMKKGPLCHQKIKCSFLHYVQLLMIGQVIWVTNFDQNVKKHKRSPMSSKNKMLIFGLRLTSDDWPSDLSNESWPKCKIWKWLPMSSRNQMLIFGLHSTSDDWLNDLSDKYRPKCKKIKKDPLCHWKIKCSFLDYIQLLLIGQAISVTNINQNAKKIKKRPPMSSKNKMLIFGLSSTSDDQLSDLTIECQPKCKKQKMKEGPLCHKKIIIPSNKSWLKCGKRPPKSLKNEMLIFGLHSTSDDQLCNQATKVD